MRRARTIPCPGSGGACDPESYILMRTCAYTSSSKVEQSEGDLCQVPPECRFRVPVQWNCDACAMDFRLFVWFAMPVQQVCECRSTRTQESKSTSPRFAAICVFCCACAMENYGFAPGSCAGAPTRISREATRNHTVGTPYTYIYIYTPLPGLGLEKKENGLCIHILVYMQTAQIYSSLYIHHHGGAGRPHGGVYW